MTRTSIYSYITSQLYHIKHSNNCFASYAFISKRYKNMRSVTCCLQLEFRISSFSPLKKVGRTDGHTGQPTKRYLISHFLLPYTCLTFNFKSPCKGNWTQFKLFQIYPIPTFALRKAEKRKKYKIHLSGVERSKL